MAQGGVLKPIRHRTDGYVPRDWSVPEGSECTYTGCRRGPSDCAGTLLSTASKSAASRLAPPINTPPTIASSSSSLRSATERMTRMFCVWTGRPYPRSSREFAAWTLLLLCQFLSSTAGFGLQATWASWQVLDEADGEPAANRSDRVHHMALRADGERPLAGSLGVAQVPRSARGQIAAEGGKDSARLPKTHTLRCTGWHRDESRASRGLRSDRARSLA